MPRTAIAGISPDGPQAPRVAPGEPYWALRPDELLRRLRSTSSGLTATDAGERLRAHGRNVIRERHPVSRLGVLARQLRSPLVLLLVFAALAAA
jgi:Mg2+-importing ATPase